MVVKDIRQEMLAFFEDNAQPKKYKTRQLSAIKRSSSSLRRYRRQCLGYC